MPNKQQRAIASRLALGIVALGIGPQTQRRKKLRKLPKQVQPLHIEREYRAYLVAVISRLRDMAQPLREEVPLLLARSPKRTDSIGDDIRELLARFRERAEGLIIEDEIIPFIRAAGEATSAWSRTQLYRQIKHAVGVDPFLAEPILAAQMDLFVARNVLRITNIPTKAIAEVELLVPRAVSQGLRWEQVAKDLDKRFDIAEGRARFVARDEIGSMYGQVTEARHTAIGIRRYVWQNVGDRRVRPEHVRRGDRVYRYNNPPAGGHPGEDWLCRCYPDPVLEDLLGP